MKLYNSDCLVEMKNIPDNSIDLILTDPPYELDTHGGGKSKMANRSINSNHIDFISDGFDLEKVFSEFMRIIKIPNFIIFCSNKQISKTMSYFENLKLSTTLLIWQKTNPIPFANGKYQEEVEFVIYVRGKNAPFNNEVTIADKKKIITMPTMSSRARSHPTQKPLELIKKYIHMHSFEGDVVLDCFMGSGTTGEASIEMGRDFIGIEIDTEFFSIAQKRITTTGIIPEHQDDIFGW